MRRYSRRRYKANGTRNSVFRDAKWRLARPVTGGPRTAGTRFQGNLAGTPGKCARLRGLFRARAGGQTRPCCVTPNGGPGGELFWSSCGPRRYARYSNVTARFLALDLGAESGRAVVGELDDGLLDVRKRAASRMSRSATTARCSGTSCGCGRRCAARSTRSRRRFTSVGLDAWGCDFALLGERGNLLENPYHYRDTRTDGVMEYVTARVSRRAHLRGDRRAVSAVQHAVSVVRGVSADAAAD